jgi:hypothetical protein
MSIDSVISNAVNNILIGDIYLSVRNAEGQEFVQIYPERLEKIYTHEWTKDTREDTGEYTEYKDENIAISSKVYCKFKINGKLTHVMEDMEVLAMLCFQNYDTSTIHFMPYDVQVLHDMEAEYKFSCGLVDFIERAFPELPTTCVHDYEQMKLTEDTLIGHKRRRDEILNM